MKPRGPEDLTSSESAGSIPSDNQHAPVRRVSSVCFRLYAEAKVQREHKDLLYSKFGLEKASKRSVRSCRASMSRNAGASLTPESSAVKSRSSSQPPAFRCGVSHTAKRSSASGTAIETASPTNDRRSTVYVPTGARSPTVVTTKYYFAQTYSLQSTLASRAAVAPRRKVGARRPSSPTVAPKKNVSSSKGSIPDRRSTATTAASTDTSKSRRTNNSIIAPQTARRNPNNQQQRVTAQRRINTTSSSASLEVAARRGTRASIVSPRSGSIVGRRPSTSPVQQTKRFSTIFQVPIDDEPVLVQVSRRTSSPIVAPVGAGGLRRRPSVAPIGPMMSPPAGSELSDCYSGTSPGLITSSRASILRPRDNKLEKLQEQVNVLKASLGISDEDLQWRVESAKGNAFLAADQHLANSEERYDRLVYEMHELSRPERCADEDKANVALAAKLRSLERHAVQVAEWKAKVATCHTDMVQTKKSLLAARVETELQRANLNSAAAAASAQLEQTMAKRLEFIKENLLSAQQQLKPGQVELQALLEWLGSETDRFAASVAAEDRSPSYVISSETMDAKRSLLVALRTIPECTQGSGKLSTLCSEATQLATKITASRAHDLKRTEAELERAMRDVEVWKTRREQTKEFADEMRKRESAWQKRQQGVNDESLALMRTFIPIDIADLTVEGLIARAREGSEGSGALYTYDLAVYLKTNRFLHWLVTHGDDIERANFLAVECASFFMDFTTYDINELCAMARVLPDSFSFDKDGRKRAWRTSFIEHVRMLAAQHQRETIKAGWDPVKRARRDVPLPELTARQQLNPIFSYPTDAEIDARIDKYKRQLARLKSKRERFNKLEDELIPQAKAEYVAVAEDARKEELQRAFGKTTLIALREEAKQHHLSLCKERDSVRSELVHGERAWAAMTPTFEQYQAEVAQIRALEPEVRKAPRIRGPFPAIIDVQPRERAAFKKLSVEEEAEARKRELDSAIAKRGLDISEVTSTEAAEVEVPIVKQADNSVLDLSLTAAETDEAKLMQIEDKKVVDTAPATGVVLGGSPAPLSRGFQRIKRLQVAIGVLNFLEKDFCSPKRVNQVKESGVASPSQNRFPAEASGEKPASTHRGSTSMPTTPKTAPKAEKEDGTKDPQSIPTPVQPKSKALLKLIEDRKAKESDGSLNEPIGTPRPSPFGGGKANFLGELQHRFQRKTSSTEENSSESSDGGHDGPKKPMNFLDELKRASARKNSDPTEATTATAISAPEPANHVDGRAPPAPRNFLDELKARTAPK